MSVIGFLLLMVTVRLLILNAPERKSCSAGLYWVDPPGLVSDELTGFLRGATRPPSGLYSRQAPSSGSPPRVFQSFTCDLIAHRGGRIKRRCLLAFGLFHNHGGGPGWLPAGWGGGAPANLSAPQPANEHVHGAPPCISLTGLKGFVMRGSVSGRSGR